jgi:hypothetical protein
MGRDFVLKGKGKKREGILHVAKVARFVLIRAWILYQVKVKLFRASRRRNRVHLYIFRLVRRLFSSLILSLERY